MTDRFRCYAVSRCKWLWRVRVVRIDRYGRGFQLGQFETLFWLHSGARFQPASSFKSACVFFILGLVRTVIDTGPRPQCGGQNRIRPPARRDSPLMALWLDDVLHCAGSHQPRIPVRSVLIEQFRFHAQGAAASISLSPFEFEIFDEQRKKGATIVRNSVRLALTEPEHCIDPDSTGKLRAQ